MQPHLAHIFCFSQAGLVGALQDLQVPAEPVQNCQVAWEREPDKLDMLDSVTDITFRGAKIKVGRLNMMAPAVSIDTSDHWPSNGSNPAPARLAEMTGRRMRRTRSAWKHWDQLRGPA